MMVIGAFLVSSFEIAGAKSTTGSDQSGDPGWPRERKPQPNWQQAESSQQRAGTESYQQRSSAASSYSRPSEGGLDRSGGGGFDQSGGGGFGDLDREAQNRFRGGQASQQFQDFQRGGGGFRGQR